jgi:short-subunit dehydrogenase
MPYAVVTGATQGIGKAVAEKFLKQGFSVAICARSKDDLDKASSDWSSNFPSSEILTFQADLGKKEEVNAFAVAVLTRFPQVDVLVNNAGLFFPGTFADEPEGQLESLMAVNLYSAYHITRRLLPVMKKMRSGHIFNLCSVASLQAYANGGAYSITKYALLGFSDNLRHELMPDNIKVTALMPGATWSRSWASAALPEQRLMKASDVADMIWAAYSLSPQADVEHITMRPIDGDI